MEESISGFKLRGSWGDAVEHGERVTHALREAGADGDAFEQWDEWRPKSHERLSVDVSEKTAEQASVAEGEGEKAGKEPDEDLQSAGEKLTESYEHIEEGDNEGAIEKWQDSIDYVTRAADSAGRKAVRAVENTVYQKVMTQLAPYYFDNELVSANIQKTTRNGGDPEFKKWNGDPGEGVELSDRRVGLAALLEYSDLLSSIVLGLVALLVFNRSQREWLEPMEHFRETAFLIFFTLSGTHFDPAVFTGALPLIVAYIVARVVGKYLGARSSARLAGGDRTVQRYLGLALLPQAGVAIGLALRASGSAGIEQTGVLLLNTMIGSTIIFELSAPWLTKLSLERAGEIEG